MNLKVKIAGLLLFASWLSSPAQDLAGVWTGYLQTPESKLEYELTISENGKKMDGYSLTVYIKDGVENTGIKRY